MARARSLAFEAATVSGTVPDAPQLSNAHAALMRPITIVDAHGERRTIEIPAERALTLYVDKRELVTLMTLGAAPELLVLGYLLNQSLIGDVSEVASIHVDWAVEAVAVKMRHSLSDLEARTARRIVTTGCGQGTVFGDALAQLDAVCLPDMRSARIDQRTLALILESMRQRHSVHKQAGSVHGCAIFLRTQMLAFVEDVGRHNAIDTLAGWMALHGVAGGDKIFYTTGRLTSEMVMKAAHMGVPIIVSRNGVTAMGHQLAERLGMTLFGRAANKHFLCYCGFGRLDAQPEFAQIAPTSIDD
jgi:FdhD protein